VVEETLIPGKGGIEDFRKEEAGEGQALKDLFDWERRT